MLAAKQGYTVLVSDQGVISKQKKAALYGAHISYEEKGHNLDRIRNSDFVIKSPGIPDTAQIIQELESNGVSVISEIEFATRYYDGSIIAITGSNGKTTTSLLTHHLLKEAGLNVGLGGNIGHSFAKMLIEEHYDLVVLELSSFQLENVVRFKANTAVILNITPDHLDRYDYDIDKYADAKLNITNNQTSNDQVIYNIDDTLVAQKIKLRNTDAQKIEFSITNSKEYPVRMNEGVIELNFSNGSCNIKVKDLPLIGKHNLYNTMAATAVARHYGVTCEQMTRALKSFKNAPHRLEYVDTINGVKFINDSKATNVDSVYYALEGLEQPIVWIAGGINKGNDYSQIQELVKDKVDALICLGIDNGHLFEAFGGTVDHILETDTMTNAVNKAYELAGDEAVVLLSPACSSFDLFENYESRGNSFKDSVQKLKKKLIMTDVDLI